MPAEPVREAHGALEVHLASWPQSAQPRAQQRLFGQIEDERRVSVRGRQQGQAAARDADAVARGRGELERRRRQFEPRAGSAPLQAQDAARALHDSGEHSRAA